MRFLRVSFRCFGPFEEQTLDLSGPGGLHVIYGPNEAGKSAALRGLHAFLFGFPGQSQDDFRFKYSQFRVYAVLENAAGRKLECIRRKGNKDTLRWPNDKQAFADRDLTDFLGGLDETQFEQLFGLNVSRLVEGGQTIADGKGELGEALFAAGAGMKGLRTLSQNLEERQKELYLPSGKKQPIAETLRRHRELLDQVRGLGLPAEKYAAAEAFAQTARKKAKELAEERGTVRRRLDKLKRYQAALPTIDLLDGARRRLAPVADAPLLSSDFDAKLEDARKKLTIARSQRSDQEIKQRELARQFENEQPPAAILAEEDEIDDLNEFVGADKKLREDAVKAATFSIDEKGKARDIYRELTGTTDWEQMDRLKPRLDERQRINDLANEHAAVVEHLERAAESVRKAKELLGVARTKQADTPALVDPSPWQPVVDEVMAVGPLEQQTRERTTALQAEEGRLAAEIRLFQPGGSWQMAGIAGAPVPLAETVERFRRDFDDGRRAAADVSEVMKQIKREIAELETLLIDRVGAEPIPTVNDLAAFRRGRDGGLHCIRRRLDGNADEVAERDFIGRHTPEQPLMDAVENAVRQCDTLADRLRHEADRVAASVALNEKLRRLQEHRQELDGLAEAADGERTALDQRWQAAWLASGISPAAPEIMQPWLTKWTKFCERVSHWRDDWQMCQADQERIDSLREQLADACPATRAAKTLREGLALAKTAIAQASSDRTNAEKCGEEVVRLQGALTKAELAAEEAGKRRDRWLVQWSEAVAVLRLEDVSPSVKTAQDYLARIDRMQQHLKDMRIKDARIREIEKDRSLLIDRVNRLRQRLDPVSRTTTTETLDTDFRSVESALRAARTQRTRHEQLSESLRKGKQELDQTATRLQEAEAALTALAAEAGVDVDGIPQAVQKARERAEVAPQVRQCEDALARNAHGVSLEEFIGAAQSYRDGLDQQIDDLGQRVEQLDTDVSTAEAESIDADRVLDAYRQASDAAAEARQKAALLACRLEDHVVEYAALHLARTALEKAKERYRTRNQDSLLDRAGIFFGALTDGAFTGIEIDNEDGADVLKAVRAAADRPDALVAVKGLSDGTRHQLFLALRLAGIQKRLADHEPVPLIVDDVLVSFDDYRTRATLRCLADVAKKTQVLLFTHHRHVVDQAKTIDPSIIVHELASCP